MANNGLYLFQLGYIAFLGALIGFEAALAVTDSVRALGQNRLIVDLHFSQLVKFIISPAQAKSGHRLCSGGIVQDGSQRLCGLRFTHDSFRHVIHRGRFIQISERGQIKSQRGHLFGQLRTSFAGHTKAGQQILLVGQICLDVILVATYRV